MSKLEVHCFAGAQPTRSVRSEALRLSAAQLDLLAGDGQWTALASWSEERRWHHPASKARYDELSFGAVGRSLVLELVSPDDPRVSGWPLPGVLCLVSGDDQPVLRLGVEQARGQGSEPLARHDGAGWTLCSPRLGEGAGESGVLLLSPQGLLAVDLGPRLEIHPRSRLSPLGI